MMKVSNMLFSKLVLFTMFIGTFNYLMTSLKEVAEEMKKSFDLSYEESKQIIKEVINVQRNVKNLKLVEHLDDIKMEKHLCYFLGATF